MLPESSLKNTTRFVSEHSVQLEEALVDRKPPPRMHPPKLLLTLSHNGKNFAKIADSDRDPGQRQNQTAAASETFHLSKKFF